MPQQTSCEMPRQTMVRRPTAGRAADIGAPAGDAGRPATLPARRPQEKCWIPLTAVVAESGRPPHNAQGPPETSVLRITIGGKVFGIALLLVVLMGVAAATSSYLVRDAAFALARVNETYTPLARAMAEVGLYQLEQELVAQELFTDLRDPDVEAAALERRLTQLKDRGGKVDEALARARQLVAQASEDPRYEHDLAQLVRLEALIATIDREHQDFENQSTRIVSVTKVGGGEVGRVLLDDWRRQEEEFNAGLAQAVATISGYAGGGRRRSPGSRARRASDQRRADHDRGVCRPAAGGGDRARPGPARARPRERDPGGRARQPADRHRDPHARRDRPARPLLQSHAGGDAGQGADQGHVRPVCRPAHRREPARQSRCARGRGRAPGLHGLLLRHRRLHEPGRAAHAGRRAAPDQQLLHRDVGAHPQQPGHHRQIYGRCDHGVLGPALHRARGPRAPRVPLRAGTARAAGGLPGQAAGADRPAAQRAAARDAHRHRHRRGGGRQCRLRGQQELHRDRRHREPGLAPRDAEQAVRHAHPDRGGDRGAGAGRDRDPRDRPGGGRGQVRADPDFRAAGGRGRAVGRGARAPRPVRGRAWGLPGARLGSGARGFRGLRAGARRAIRRHGCSSTGSTSLPPIRPARTGTASGTTRPNSRRCGRAGSPSRRGRSRHRAGTAKAWEGTDADCGRGAARDQRADPGGGGVVRRGGGQGRGAPRRRQSARP